VIPLTFTDLLGARTLIPRFELEAAALIHSIGSKHALVDGDKRLALPSTDTFLRADGHAFTLTTDEAFDLVMRGADGSAALDEIAAALTTPSWPGRTTTLVG
jgi:death-on-curing protein